MLPTCSISELKIYNPGNTARDLANKLSCSILTAGVLEMLKGNETLDSLKDWLNPDFLAQMRNMNLGASSAIARDLWNSKSSFGNVLVYGDYDTDGVCSTVLAMEIFRTKAAQVRYFIPRRDAHGYGLNAEILEKIAVSGCNTLVVVDCGTNDSEMLEKLRSKGIDIFVFDHHSISAPITIPAIVNPCTVKNNNSSTEENYSHKICATAVLWCWAWKENIISRNWLKYAIDLVALATIADCMPLHNLNRSLVRYGMDLMRNNPRRGLSALFDCLGINRLQLTEEHLSMRVIPCLNAPGRISTADISVRALLGVGNNDAVYSCVNDLMRTNRKRQSLTENITKDIDTGIMTGEITQKVLFNEGWPIGVLSGVASRICAQYRIPIVLAAPVVNRAVRGTLRVPEGGNAVGILGSIADKLEAWGGHKYAAGFSVLHDKWFEVSRELEKLLSEIEIAPGELTPVMSIKPSEISISDWKSISALGPFGNNNPAPKFYTENNISISEINPLGKDNKHSFIKMNNSKLLAFGISVPDIVREITKIKGWVYHPRLNYWHNEEQLQFILDYAVTE